MFAPNDSTTTIPYDHHDNHNPEEVSQYGDHQEPAGIPTEDIRKEPEDIYDTMLAKISEDVHAMSTPSNGGVVHPINFEKKRKRLLEVIHQVKEALDSSTGKLRLEFSGPIVTCRLWVTCIVF